MHLKTALVGYTGFVGSNIDAKGNFDSKYNSKNIEEAFSTNPDILLYAGIRAEKYIADKFPERDFNSILNAIENIKKINPKTLILISTIDVYNAPVNVYEDSHINKQDLKPYGKNRLFLEEWVEENFEHYCIVRLPIMVS